MYNIHKYTLEYTFIHVYISCVCVQVYAVTNVHGLQLWDFGSEECLVDVEDMRPACSQAAAREIDYLIDCWYANRRRSLLYVLGLSFLCVRSLLY
jgi:hypothetical protein